ncbi:MAG: tRNA (adenosine(37)-N6)-dimethylallyltransferase MiaA [Bacilli bacterium]|nr:tRNA (adenosine(37)-N6)-dimethylallyltransferase MiaA [Bacilli bacterium]
MIYVICGPTGSGKTEIAKILSNKYDAPIINADAFQIYREMNIGTAKISKDDPYYQKHYLLDIKSPDEEFSVMEYQKLFRETVDKLLKDNKDIIVCGGTGLYIRASVYDYEFEQQQEDDVSDLEQMNNEELYALLTKLDPEATKTIHMNNRKRVIRAISIARNNDHTKSEMINKQNHELIYPEIRFLMISPEREKLYQNLNKRVDLMFENGLVEETNNLLNKYQLSKTAQAAIGYKEIIDALENNKDLQSAKELIKQRTRNYAKRQVTFFKHQLPVEIFENKEELLKAL